MTYNNLFRFWAAAPKGSMTYAFTHIYVSKHILFLPLLLLLLRKADQQTDQRTDGPKEGQNNSLSRVLRD